MKSRINEQGSAAHVVVILVLVVAVLGLLGFVFYQNFIQKDEPTEPTTSQTTAPEANVTEGMILETRQLDGYTLTFERPEDWKYDERGFTSPEYDVTVSLALINPSGLGGTCGPVDGPVTDPLRFVGTESVAGYDGAIFAEYISENTEDERLYYSFGLQPSSNESIKNARLGDSTCHTFSAVPGFVRLNNDYSTTLRGQATFLDVSQVDGSVLEGKTVSDIEAAFESEAGQQARQILLSAKISR